MLTVILMLWFWGIAYIENWDRFRRPQVNSRMEVKAKIFAQMYKATTDAKNTSIWQHCSTTCYCFNRCHIALKTKHTSKALTSSSVKIWKLAHGGVERIKTQRVERGLYERVWEVTSTAWFNLIRLAPDPQPSWAWSGARTQNRNLDELSAGALRDRVRVIGL